MKLSIRSFELGKDLSINARRTFRGRCAMGNVCPLDNTSCKCFRGVAVLVWYAEDRDIELHRGLSFRYGNLTCKLVPLLN